jgi:hypothetical protein
LQSKKDARVHCAVLNDQPAIPPATAPAPTPPGTKRCAIRRTRTETTHPTPGSHRAGVRSLRTQQRAYDRPPTTTTFPTRTRAGRTSSGHRQPAELVSVPPSSTTPDTRPGTPAGHRVRIRARLCTTTPSRARRRDAP